MQVSHNGALELLRMMRKRMPEVYTKSAGRAILEQDQHTLIVLTNNDFLAKLDSENVNLNIFDVPQYGLRCCM